MPKRSDCFSAAVRSRVMSAVKSNRNKSTELKLIQIYKENHIIGWRRNYKIIGRPDFVFIKPKIAVFADGCFWHGHNCRNTKPKANKSFWANKINRNRLRDRKNNLFLRKSGWIVLRFWECEINSSKYKSKLKKLVSYLPRPSLLRQKAPRHKFLKKESRHDKTN